MLRGYSLTLQIFPSFPVAPREDEDKVQRENRTLSLSNAGTHRGIPRVNRIDVPGAGQSGGTGDPVACLSETHVSVSRLVGLYHLL